MDLGKKNQTHYFSFTAVITSMNAKLLYLSRENFEAFQKYISREICQNEV